MNGGRISLSHLFLSAHEVLGAKVCTTMAGNCEWYIKTNTRILYISVFLKEVFALKFTSEELY